jgi:hypothetical protein
VNIINYTNINLADRIIRILSTGLSTKDLTVYIRFPRGEERKILGRFTAPPPTIKVFIHKDDPPCYDHEDKLVNITNIHQYIALIFLHELYHYVAWKKSLAQAETQEENLATYYACKTLRRIGLKI